METSRCHDCGVAPGLAHLRGCDVARCARCGAQRLFCPCEDSPPDIFTGQFPDTGEARALGWWARLTPDGWQPCPPDAPGARPDLNRLGFYKEYGFDGNYSVEELATGLRAEPPSVGLDGDGIEE